MSRTAVALALAAVAGFGFACDRASSCPPCECACEGGQGDATKAGPEPDPGGGPAQNPTGAAAGLSPGDLGELVAAANRELAHGDGPGCLAELDKVKAIDAKLDAQLILVRAQCRMAAGECQAGKQAIADWYEREQAMTPERAAIMAESMASMRCQGGDASERDRLLAAYFDLSDGAYINKRDVEFCKTRVATIADLADKVPARDVEDTQITGGRQALFFTGAMCFARAGDCDAAYAHFAQFFPSESLTALDPTLREDTVRQAFASSIELCAKP